MALQMSVESSIGLTVDQAYCRVECPQIGPDKASMTFRLRSYTEATGVPAFADQGFSCPYALSQVNPIRQGYLYLKTLPEFADAADC